jgi:hypothetical protein
VGRWTHLEVVITKITCRWYVCMKTGMPQVKFRLVVELFHNGYNREFVSNYNLNNRANYENTPGKTVWHTFVKMSIARVLGWIRLRNLYRQKLHSESYVVDTGFVTFGLKMTKLWLIQNRLLKLSNYDTSIYLFIKCLQNF